MLKVALEVSSSETSLSIPLQSALQCLQKTVHVVIPEQPN